MDASRRCKRSRSSGGNSSNTRSAKAAGSAWTSGFQLPGWSQSGGPWVKPGQAMRYVALPELRLHGRNILKAGCPRPRAISRTLPCSPFPAPAGDGDAAKITARTPTSVCLPDAVRVYGPQCDSASDQAHNVEAELQASDDGVAFRSVKKFTIDRHNLEVERRACAAGADRRVAAGHDGQVLSAELFVPTVKLGDVQLSSAARVDSIAEKSLVKGVSGSAAAL